MTLKKENPGKRGVKPYFTGSRGKLLEDNLEKYVSLKYQNRNQFWFEFFTKWWETYPWKLGDKDEPPLDNPAKMVELASVGEGEILTKSKVENELVGRIKSWFAYQAQTKVSHDHNNWFSLLQRLHESSNPKPRKRSLVQQFMLEEPTLVDIKFEIRFGNGRGLDVTERMNRRHEVAKKLLNERYQHRVLGLEANARETHEKEMRQWSLALSNIALAPDVNAARDSVFSAAHSLLKAIGAYTGCYVTLIAAAIPSVSGNNDYFSAVHHVPDGKGSRQNWTEWDMDGFRVGVARPFKKYIRFMETAPAPSPGVASTMDPTANPAPTSSMAQVPPHPPQRDGTDIVKVAPKRTAAGSYKQRPKDRPIVYTEDSDEWSDHPSDWEEAISKRPRTEAVVTRSRSKHVEKSSDNDPLHDAPPNTATLLQSPGPSDRLSIDPPNHTIPRPSGQQSPSPSTLSVDQATVDSAVKPEPEPENHGTPSPSIPTVEKTPSPDTSLTESRNVGATSILSADAVSSCGATTVIPKFLTVALRKNKASIYSYLINRKDPRFQNLLQLYIAFENAVVASEHPGSFSTSGRPTQISWWIRCARVDAPPPLFDLLDYGSSVITWWSSLQPAWRKLKCGTPNRDNGAFNSLAQPGINGLLNIIILAYWWSDGLAEMGTNSDEESIKYQWFVDDASWVISKLLETTKFN